MRLTIPDKTLEAHQEKADYLRLIVAFALFGIEAISLEIKNPFGYDVNDIPLSKPCQKLHNDIERLIASPASLDIREAQINSLYAQRDT